MDHFNGLLGRVDHLFIILRFQVVFSGVSEAVQGAAAAGTAGLAAGALVLGLPLQHVVLVYFRVPVFSLDLWG